MLISAMSLERERNTPVKSPPKWHVSTKLAYSGRCTSDRYRDLRMGCLKHSQQYCFLLIINNIAVSDSMLSRGPHPAPFFRGF